MRRLYASQLVEVLSGGEYLARRLRTLELGRIAANRLHLRFEDVGDVDHERRFDRVFAIRQGVQNLVWAMRLAATARGVLRESREVTRVATKLGRDAMIRMSPDRKRQNHHTRSCPANQLDDSCSRRLIVFKMRIAQTCVESRRHQIGRASCRER